MVAIIISVFCQLYCSISIPIGVIGAVTGLTDSVMQYSKRPAFRTPVQRIFIIFGIMYNLMFWLFGGSKP